MNKNEIDNKHFGIQIANGLNDEIMEAYERADAAIQAARSELVDAEAARMRVVDAAIRGVNGDYRNRGRGSCDAAELRCLLALDRKIASEVLESALAKRYASSSDWVNEIALSMADLGMGSVELVEIKSVNDLFEADEQA